MAFKKRLTKPERGNKYFITKAKGGYSNAIQGSPVDADCNVLCNCVGYAYGRFNEIGGYGSCKYLAPVNAENFIQYKGSCEVGQTPKLGACMVWQKGATLSGSDGAGHVAIVEEVISDDEVVTSESGYAYKAFWTQHRKKGSNGRWGSGEGYKFLGFIYNPAVENDKEVLEVTVTKAELQAMIAEEVKKAKEPVYEKITDVPTWYRPSVQKLIDKKYMNGTDSKKSIISVSETFCRVITVLDNAGLIK